MARAGQQKKSEKLRVFSERFKSALRKSNLQDNEIAEKLGVAPSAISNWRQGLNRAKGKNLRRLAEVLKCGPEWLLGEEEHEVAGVLSGARIPYRKDPWQQRALVAEKKLADLRSGLRYLLEASDVVPRPGKLEAGPLATAEAAEALKKAGGVGDIRPEE